MKDEQMMPDLQSSVTSSRAGLKVIRDLLNEKIRNHSIFCNKSTICEKCKCDHANMHCALTATVFNTRTSNLAMIINRIENKKNLSLRMVKAAKKKGKYTEIENLRNAESDTKT